MAVTYRFTTSVNGTAGSTAIVKGMLTQAAVNSNYPAGNTLNGKVTLVAEGWQKFQIEYTGDYTFTVVGAAGGHVANINLGGKGAKLTGKIALKKGDIIYVLVGQVGWSNPSWADWGGGGGGASAVLLANTASGKFTFEPGNQKVDAIFVAGGGGGAADNGFSGKHGYNANINNGTNTNAGLSDYPTGGAGLTGSTTLSPTILSGKASSYHRCAFGGGGRPYDGGGGGGGYSGGNGNNNALGGYGGTSWIDSRVTNTTRALDTGVMHGYVQMVITDEVTKSILAQDSEGYKYFNSTLSKWQLMTKQTTPITSDYKTYGVSKATNINGLQKETVKFLLMSTETNGTVDVTGIISPKLLIPNYSISTFDIDNIRSVTASISGSGGSFKFVVSNDDMHTWKTLIGNTWTDIDIDDIESVTNNGITTSALNTISSAKWNEIKTNQIAFAVLVEQSSALATISLNSISLRADLVGSWKKALHGTDYDYEYPYTDQVKITFKVSGSYKINYMDSVEE